jgi:hypothetical protein
VFESQAGRFLSLFQSRKMALPAFIFDVSPSGDMFTVLQGMLEVLEHDSDNEYFEGTYVREYFDPTAMAVEIFPDSVRATNSFERQVLAGVCEKRKQRRAKKEEKHYYDDLSDFSHVFKLMTGENCGDKRLCQRNDPSATPFYFTSCSHCRVMAPDHFKLAFN